MKSKQQRIREMMELAPVIPVLRFENVDDAVNTSRALVAGGLPMIEITLRSDAALECIAAVGKHVPGAIVGAGTVLNRQLLSDCLEAGSQFFVSPGSTQELIEAAAKTDIPLLPGIATPSEAMGMLAEGYEHLKFFPAEQAGGAAYLKSIAPVLPTITFCPTGGLNAQKAPDYLALPNVACVGGSWVAPGDLITAGDWDGISELASKAVQLKAG
ncbi:MAG: bifunctional 4-hydroxy-2-oxoglutarate aldolase/2-dehydro-3-deoxy-phosphogluconate aldolase [Pseudomonadota bacterium]